MKKLLCSIFAMLLLSNYSAEAQFFKKLTKKISEKVEETVTRNISDKAAKEADKTLNNIWETELKDMSFDMGAMSVDPAKIPDSYDFDWKYSMNMETTNGSTNLVYRLKEDAPYMGMKFQKVEDMFVVVDNEKDITIIYMGDIVRASQIESEVEAENAYSDMKYEKIGSKTILGYEADGYQAETEEYVYTIYVTDEAGIGFNNMYQNPKNIPENFNPEWIDENSLLMEMQMEHKTDPEKNMAMRCTGLDKEAFTISK